MHIQDLVTGLHAEVAFFQTPLAIHAHEGEVTTLELQGNGLGFARLEFYLVEMTQTTVVRCEACHEVGTEEQDAFLAHASTDILHIRTSDSLCSGYSVGRTNRGDTSGEGRDG